MVRDGGLYNTNSLKFIEISLMIDPMGRRGWLPHLGLCIFTFPRLCQLCSQPCPESRTEWPQSLCFLQCATKLGIMCSTEWVWGQRAAASRSSKVPSGTWRLSCGACGTLHQLPREQPPFFPPSGRLDPAYDVSLLPSAQGVVPLFSCAGATLHLHNASEKSCWLKGVGLGGHRPDRSWRGSMRSG